MIARLAVAIAAMTLVTWSALAETITGPARPMDGDTFEVEGVVIRLVDIDAPEMAQKCQGGPRKLRNCGAFVADTLAERIRGQPVECEVQTVDAYQRRVASCTHDGEDLSAWLVTEGLALAFRRFLKRLVPEEDGAKAAGGGCGRRHFEVPWEYRHRWEVAAQAAPGSCPIKGNINSEGVRIYHSPWGSQWYDRNPNHRIRGRDMVL